MKKLFLPSAFFVALAFYNCNNSTEKHVNNPVNVRLITSDSSFTEYWNRFSKAYQDSNVALLQSMSNECIISTENADSVVSLNAFLINSAKTGVSPSDINGFELTKSEIKNDTIAFEWQNKFPCIISDTAMSQSNFSRAILSMPVSNNKREGYSLVFSFIKKKDGYKFFELFTIP